MILNSTKFGGNRTKDVEVGPDRRTDRQADSYIPPPPPNYVCRGYKNSILTACMPLTLVLTLLYELHVV